MPTPSDIAKKRNLNKSLIVVQPKIKMVIPVEDFALRKKKGGTVRQTPLSKRDRSGENCSS